MIKKIASIKNLAVFDDFNWDSCVKDKAGVTLDFGKINIIYGRNYSGKTTLSRIFRAIETHTLPEKYENPQFEVLMKNGTTITQNTLSTSSVDVRVFNEDFVRNNLRFLIDPTSEIESFAILGTDPNVIAEIEALESEIGSSELDNESGLYKECIDGVNKAHNANEDFRAADTALEKKLSGKATDTKTGIKYNANRFGDQNYNISKLKRDIAIISEQTYLPLSVAEKATHESTLNEQEKTADSLPMVNLNMKNHIEQTATLLSRKIGTSNKIQELLRDAALNEWVKQGKNLLDGQLKCAFCGNPISMTRWKEINAHFDEESKLLESEINALINAITDDKEHLSRPISFDKTKFYVKYHSDIDSFVISMVKTIGDYCASLDRLIEQLRTRKENITLERVFQPPTDNTTLLQDAVNKFNDLVKENNDFSRSLGSAKSKAQEALRLQEVADFCNTVGYGSEMERIGDLKKKADELKSGSAELNQMLQDKQQILQAKKRLLNDEEEGAKRVNKYLNNYFGHNLVTLEAEEVGEGEKHIRFRVMRDGKPAYNLSEGECSLISFCYFMAKLEDIETDGKKPIIWIDDPISSLDSNHVFFIYSILRARIVEPKKYDQLFISTHNLDFLKYLKRITGRESDSSIRRFIIHRNNKTATIAVMPTYLWQYVTEFNYLFHEIYKCSKIVVVNDENHIHFYNFANNARKFLEILTYYNYPCHDSVPNKLEKFFGEGRVPALLVDRVNNEFSHLSGGFERGAEPIEVPEMLSTAKLIIKTIQEKNPEQYAALLSSIGERLVSTVGGDA